QLRQERETIASLADKANLGPERICDVHLCYGDVPEIVFKGFLVTGRGDLDRPIAFCPVLSHRLRYGYSRFTELKRAFTLAVNVAALPETGRRAGDLLWLADLGDMDRAVPGWVFGLRCVPLVGEWDGEFNSPRPFCPALFEQMARQPQALRWLAQQSIAPLGDVASDPALSARVRQVLKCLTSGYSEKETANELGISKHTIHVYVKHLYRHFDVHSRNELLSLFVDAPAEG
ncbi:MAG TPA: helix-turn-helix transcriptional regulator, partial [Tepidisphaeraceae bacterium]|nr:helix-turn-helix transcriptional regulator [Tepidisphaeraceae bacterium]